MIAKLMMQARQLLRPDALFLVSLLGGNSLIELKQALAEAEQDITGIAVCAVRQWSYLNWWLINRAGLALPVADSNRLTVNYPHM